MEEEPLPQNPQEKLNRSQLRREKSKEKLEKMLRLEALDENRTSKKSAKEALLPLEEQDQNICSRTAAKKNQAPSIQAQTDSDNMVLEEAEGQPQDTPDAAGREPKQRRPRQPQQKGFKNRNKENEPPKPPSSRRTKLSAGKSRTTKRVTRHKQARQALQGSDEEVSSQSGSSGSAEDRMEPQESLEESEEDRRRPSKASNPAKQPMEEEPVEPSSAAQESPRKKARGSPSAKQSIEDEHEIINSILLSNLSPLKAERLVSDGKRDSPKKFSPQKKREKAGSPSKARSPQKKQKSPEKEPEEEEGEEEAQVYWDMQDLEGIPLEDLIRNGQLVIEDHDPSELLELLGMGEEEMEYEFEVHSEAAHYLKIPKHQWTDYFKKLNDCYFDELDKGKETPKDKEDLPKKVTFDKKKKVKSTRG